MFDAGNVTTRKLYYENAYLRKFTGKVLSFEQNDVVLDQTAFFPEEGGQSPDHGYLEGFYVKDVQIRDGQIHHYLDLLKRKSVTSSGDPDANFEECEPTDKKQGDGSAASQDNDILTSEEVSANIEENRKEAGKIFREGTEVHGEIAWDERYSNMQMHSGEHIFSGLVYKKFGYDNIGFHLSPHEMTLDFGGPIPENALYEIETEANRAVFENVKTQIVFPTKEEREKMTYRSKLDLEGEVRIVIFPGYDACACCAPHVRSTAEIGLIKAVSIQNWKQGVRISLVCGRRAFEMLRKEHEIVRRTAGFLSAAEDELYDLTVRAREDNISLKSSVKDLGRRLLQAEAQGIPMEAENAVIFEKDIDSKAARDAVNMMMERHRGYCGVFLGSDKKGWNYIIGSKEKNCREINDTLRKNYGARGGGKPEMVQGSVQAEKNLLEKLFAACKKNADPV